MCRSPSFIDVELACAYAEYYFMMKRYDRGFGLMLNCDRYFAKFYSARLSNGLIMTADLEGLGDGFADRRSQLRLWLRVTDRPESISSGRLTITVMAGEAQGQKISFLLYRDSNSGILNQET